MTNHTPHGRGHRVLGALADRGAARLGHLFGIVHRDDLTRRKRRRLTQLLLYMANDGLIFEVDGAHFITLKGRALLAELNETPPCPSPIPTSSTASFG